MFHVKHNGIKLLCFCAIVVLIALFCACEMPGEDGGGTDGEPGTPTSLEDGAAAPSPPSPPASLAVRAGQRYNDVFCLAWAPDAAAHPVLNVNRFNHDVYTLVYESLFTLDERFEPVLGLCAALDAGGDGRTFTLTLPAGAAFHDGSPLTADDVVYSFTLARGESSPYAQKLHGIKEVKAGGGEAETVTVTLTAANPRFPALLTFPILKRDSAKGSFPWPGTGPYRFATGSDGVMSLELHTTWWKHDPMPLGHIELYRLSGLDELPYLLGVGDVSAVVIDPGDSFGVGFKGDFAVWEYPTAILQYIGVNAKHPLLGDRRMRRALSYAIDRPGLCETVYQGDADPALLPAPPSSPLYADALPEARWDAARDLTLTSALLNDMGLADESGDGFLQYPDGKIFQDFSLRFLVEEDDGTACEAVLYLCGQLAEAGVNAEYTPLPRAAFSAALKEGEYELYYARETVPADFDTRDWARREGGHAAGGVSVASLASLAAWDEYTPAIPLLFRRQALITRRSVADGVKPVYLRPFDNFSGWKIRK